MGTAEANARLHSDTFWKTCILLASKAVWPPTYIDFYRKHSVESKISSKILVVCVKHNESTLRT